VDWNNDGRKDLITGERNGYIRIYVNTGTDAKPVFNGFSYLQVGGSTFDCGVTSMPEIVDWNNDGRKDVLCGDDYGNVRLLLNVGSDASPVFASTRYIRNGAMNLDVGSRASVAVADWNLDGKKDLLVGETYGRIYYFENKGTDAGPVFNGYELLTAGGSTIDVGLYSRLDVVDWNNDGLEDIICGCYDTPGTSMGLIWYFQRINIDTTPPAVNNVLVRGDDWSAEFLGFLGDEGLGDGAHGYSVPAGTGQLDEIPWVNIDRISITFTEDVNVAQSNLMILGANVPRYQPSGFRYDGSTFTATWSFAAPIEADRLMLWMNDSVTDGAGNALDGEWWEATSSYPSGNGSAGGSFFFRLKVLPGDVDGNGEVRSSDTIKVRRKSGTSLGEKNYSPFHDVDGSGEIGSSDTIKVRRKGNTYVPSSVATGSYSVPPSEAVLFPYAAPETSEGTARTVRWPVGPGPVDVLRCPPMPRARPGRRRAVTADRVTVSPGESPLWPAGGKIGEGVRDVLSFSALLPPVL